MPSFNESLKVFESKDAARYAGALFQDSFGSAFPVPVTYRVLETDIGPKDWRQYVAMYTWPDGTEECVGFANWIKYRDVYLEGGLAVRKNFYRRLPKSGFAECSARGGVAQIVMETAARQLLDCAAWFGYVGDPKSMQVGLRVGYNRTDLPYLIVKWMRSMDDTSKEYWIREVARIGPF